MGFVRRAIDGYLDRRLVQAADRALGRDERWAHLCRHGTFPLAYAAFAEPYIKSFGDERGFLAYGQKMGVTIAMGDPLTAPKDVPDLVDEFIGRMRRPCFAAVGEDTARLLATRGYTVTPFGHDSVVDLGSHSFAGRNGKRIRYASSWLTARGMRIEERSVTDFDPREIDAMSDEWRQTRVVTRREIQFLNRVFEPLPEPGVRRFFALDAEGRPQGFVSFDPVFRDGQTIGYLASNKRRYPKDAAYLDLAIMRHAIDTFKAERRTSLWLGLSPMAPTEPAPFRADPLVKRIFDFGFRSSWVNRNVFNLQGVAEYKNRFRGHKITAYVATPPGRGIFQVVALLRLIKIF